MKKFILGVFIGLFLHTILMSLADANFVFNDIKWVKQHNSMYKGHGNIILKYLGYYHLSAGCWVAELMADKDDDARWVYCNDE